MERVKDIMAGSPLLLPAIIATVILFIGIFPLPYGYYQFLRWIICGIALFIVYKAYTYKKIWIAVVFCIVAILFNPVSTIHFEKDIWMWLDFVCVVVFMTSILVLRKPLNSEEDMMPRGYNCPGCSRLIKYGSNPCPRCKAVLDWRQEKPSVYMPPFGEVQQQVVEAHATPSIWKKSISRWVDFYISLGLAAAFSILALIIIATNGIVVPLGWVVIFALLLFITCYAIFTVTRLILRFSDKLLFTIGIKLLLRKTAIILISISMFVAIVLVVAFFAIGEMMGFVQAQLFFVIPGIGIVIGCVIMAISNRLEKQAKEKASKLYYDDPEGNQAYSAPGEGAGPTEEDIALLKDLTELAGLYIQKSVLTLKEFITKVISNHKSRKVLAFVLLGVILLISVPIGINAIITKLEQSDSIILNAKVIVDDSRITVKNNNSYDWHDVRLYINKGLGRLNQLNYGSMENGRTYTFDAKEFADTAGLRFNIGERKIIKISISGHAPSGKLIESDFIYDGEATTSFKKR